MPPIGPGEVPILKAGKVYPAFLEKEAKQDYYVPAARGASFHRLKQDKVDVKKDT